MGSKTDPSWPWAGLPIQVPHNAQALFHMAVETIVRNGESTRFQADRWLNGKTLAPNLFKSVSEKTMKCRTVAQALINRRWVSDTEGVLTVQVLVEYLLIWDLVDGFVLQQDIQDHHRWKLARSGTYTSKSWPP